MGVTNQLQEKESQTRDKPQSSQRVVGRSVFLKGIQCAIRFLLGAVLAGGEVLGSAAPFGVGLVGASGAGFEGISALVGACFGYLLTRGLTDGLRYAAACILVFSVCFAFYDVKTFRKAWFMPLATALLSGTTGFIYLYAQRFRGESPVLFLGELALTAASVYFFRIAFAPWKITDDTEEYTFRQRVSLLLLGVAVLISLAQLELMWGISTGRLCACLLVMVASCKGGPGTGAALGVAAGIAMDLAAGGVPFYSMAYGFSGLVCGAFWKQSRLVCALTYVLANGIAVLWTWESGLSLTILYEVFISSVVFMLLPEKLLSRWALFFAPNLQVEGREKATEGARLHLKATADAFTELFSALKGAFAVAGPNDNDTSAVFDRAANRVCHTCSLRDDCWQRNYNGTFSALNDALPAILTRSRGQAEDFPLHFRTRCVKFPPFLAAVNEEVAALLTRQQYQCRLRESRRAVCRQYDDLAQVLTETADSLTAPLTPDQARTRRLRQHLLELDLDGQVLVFFDDKGRLEAQIEGRGLTPLTTDTARGKLATLLGLPLRSPLIVPTDKGQRLTFRQGEPLAAEAGAAGRKKDGQTVSGDASTWFKGEDGTLYILLCDGMGSGPDARQESTLAIRLLEKFLRAGVRPEAALKTLNSALALRGEENVGFSTIDLLAIDLFTGKGGVYKYGAAPSYIKRGGTVTRLAGGSLPAGLLAGEGTPPDHHRFQVEAGDCIVLVSDGVVTGEDSWMREALSSFQGNSLQDLATQLVTQPSEMDDKTAVVIRIKETA